MTAYAKAFSFAAALACAAGCDYAQQKELKDERADKHYQAAMKDYTEGRIDAALAGFEKAVKSNPGNASARFQLACLLQDSKQDYLGALCCYREYVRLEPSSDKANLAKNRAALCEKQLSVDFAKKYGGAGAAAVEAEKARAALSAMSNRLAKAESKLAENSRKAESLAAENARLRRMLGSIGEDSGTRPSPPSITPEARSLLADDGEAQGRGRLKLTPEALALFEESEREDALLGAAGSAAPGYDGPSLLEAAKSGGGAASALAGVTPETKPANPPHEERPEWYEVKEGDTLYRIAIRFYGRRDMWRKIQEANKATISSDARIKVGQMIRLP